MLLRQALVRSGGEHSLQPSPDTMVQSRAQAELQGGKNLTVLWTMTSLERERNLLPVRIPIDKGLLGWRVALIQSAQLAKFGQIGTADALKVLVAGQGSDWPDTSILRSNGFTVEGVTQYDALFKLLAAGRFDYFPRSILEVQSEAQEQAARGIVVEPSFALHYPTALYFFVNRTDRALAQDIDKGLEAMQADGSFDRLFHQFHDSYIQETHLKTRRVFELKNPLLPPETPIDRKSLWFQP